VLGDLEIFNQLLARYERPEPKSDISTPLEDFEFITQEFENPYEVHNHFKKLGPFFPGHTYSDIFVVFDGEINDEVPALDKYDTTVWYFNQDDVKKFNRFFRRGTSDKLIRHLKQAIAKPYIYKLLVFDRNNTFGEAMKLVPYELCEKYYHSYEEDGKRMGEFVSPKHGRMEFELRDRPTNSDSVWYDFYIAVGDKGKRNLRRSTKLPGREAYFLEGRPHEVSAQISKILKQRQLPRRPGVLIGVRYHLDGRISGNYL